MEIPDKSDLLGQLLEIGRQMAETQALEPLLNYAVDICLELLDAQFGYLVLANDDGTLDFRVARNRHGEDIIQPETQISRTILYRVINDKRVLVSASAVTDEDFAHAVSVNALKIKSVLCVPLVALGKAIGVIYMENRVEDDVFSEADAEPLKYLAGHAAVCIQNVILNKQLERLSSKHLDELPSLDDDETPSEKIKAVIEEERTRILYSFIRDASHQFKTPLSVIKTSVDLLKRKSNPVITSTYLSRIEEQISTIVRLVDSLNLLAKLDSNVDWTLERDNLAYIVQDMKEVSLMQAMNRQIKLEDHSMVDEGVEIALMQSYARQAIGKVLENAIMYTEPGGKITLDVIDTGDTGQVVISDTGIGISSEDLPRVTTRFYRVDTAGTTRGLGLGLTIAETIMKAHGGSLIINSELGQGTSVRLIFPKN